MSIHRRTRCPRQATAARQASEEVEGTAFAGRTTAQIAALQRDVASLQTQTSILSKWRATVVGALIVLSFLVTAVVTAVLTIVTGLVLRLIDK